VGEGQQQSNPSAGQSFLRPPPAPPNLGGQSPPRRPSALAADAGAPGTRPPLPAPGGKPGDGTPTPPGINMTRPEIFSKNHSWENTPRLIGPEPNNFKTIFDRGITQMDGLIDTP
jgi:hypothetical protein